MQRPSQDKPEVPAYVNVIIKAIATAVVVLVALIVIGGLGRLAMLVLGLG